MIRKKFLAFLLLGAFGVLSCKDESPADGDLADLVIINAAVFDGTGSDIIPKASIAIKDGKVLKIDKNNQQFGAQNVIDAKGKTIMPGLINSHFHLFFDFYSIPPNMPAYSDATAEQYISRELPATLESHLSQGITSLLSPIDFWPHIYNLKEKVVSGEIKGPNVFIAGPILVNKGDHYACGSLTGDAKKWCEERIALYVDTPEQAIAAVQNLVKNKVDVVVYDGMTNQPVFNKVAFEALVKEAHKNNLKVLIHNADAKDVKDMVNAGTDGFIHPPIGTLDTDGSLLSIVGERKLPIAITLGFTQRLIELGYASEKDKDDYVTLENNVQKMLKAGAIPLFTSDMPGIPAKEVIPTVIKVMKGQGIDNKTILLSATREGAKALGQKNLGTLESGKIADLILVDGNPLEDINSLTKVDLVVKKGLIVVDKRK